MSQFTNKINSLFGVTLACLFGVCVSSCEDEGDPGIVGGAYAAFEQEVMNVNSNPDTITLSVDYPWADVDQSSWSIWGIMTSSLSSEGEYEQADYECNENRTWARHEWLTAEKVMEDGVASLRLKIERNDTKRTRAKEVTIVIWTSKTSFFHSSVEIIQAGKSTREEDKIKIRYKGKEYASIIHYGSNDSIIYENTEVRELIDMLNKKGGIETVVSAQYIDFFDEEDFETRSGLRELFYPIDSKQTGYCGVSELTGTRSYDFTLMDPKALGFCILYDDKDFSDTKAYHNLMGLNDIWEIGNLRGVGLNDKVSSLALAYNGNSPDVCAILTVWEDRSFNFGDNDRTKHRMNFIATYNNPKMDERRLKSIPCIGSNNSWNDRISSISFHFGNYGSYPKEY